MEKENFKILKVKVTNTDLSLGGAISLGSYVDNTNYERKATPTIKILDALKPFTLHLAEVLHHDPDDKKDLSWINEHVIATGFTLSEHKKHGLLVSIMGKMRTPSGKWIGLSSEVIPLEDNIYGFEELETEIGLLSNECYDFFFGNKEEQLEMKHPESIGEQKKEDTKVKSKDEETKKCLKCGVIMSKYPLQNKLCTVCRKVVDEETEI